MGIRINTALDLTAGFNNDTANRAFGGAGVLSEVLDTLENVQSSTYQLGALETQALDFGDVAQGRYLYLEGDGEFSVAFSAALATAAAINGAAGTYPTAFAGGEVLALEIDGTAVTVTMDVADQTRDQVVARINFAAALADASFVSNPVAFQNGSQLSLRSPNTGTGSTVEVLVTTSSSVLTALGLSVSAAQGSASEPGTTDVEVRRPADPSGASAAYGVKSYLLGTVQCTAVQVTNLMDDAALNLKVLIAGDLVS